ncbi:MAG: AI-2E family transporter [Chromatiales bacterium]|jgi:predicted PurR-regulated permease PerM|nr:AI-2E family transporter [Chromatiales bacterium]
MSADRRWWWLAIAVVAVALIWLLSPILMPFAVAGILAYLAAPLVGRLVRLRVPRTAATLLVLLLMLVLLAALPLLAFPMIENQVSMLLRNWPHYLAWTNNEVLPWVAERLGLDIEALDLSALRETLMQHWQVAGGLATRVLSAVGQSWMTLLAWLINLGLIPVITFYLLRDWDKLLTQASALLPRHVAPIVIKLTRECDEVLASFLRGQLWVMIALGLVYAIGLWLAGLDLGLLIGFIAGAVSFVPYLGVIVGFSAAVIAGLVQHGGDATILLPVALVFGVGQLLESLVLTPLLVGDRIGLHPVAVIFAVLAGGQLFGAFGVLLALPVAAVVVVVLRYAYGLYLKSRFYDEPPSAGGKAAGKA